MRCKYEGLAEFRGWSVKGKLDEMTSYFCGGLGTVSFLSQLAMDVWRQGGIHAVEDGLAGRWLGKWGRLCMVEGDPLV
jgi:hypothetical protein